MTKEIYDCTGCLYYGMFDGAEPECNCHKRDVADSGLSKKSDSEELDSANCKSRFSSVSRRDRSVQKQKKANQTLSILESKSSRCDSLSDDEQNRINKKLKNATKKAKRNYQTILTLTFPASFGKKVNGKNIKSLISLFSDKMWEKKDITPEEREMLSAACDNAINTLETALQFNGELVAFFKEGNVLTLTVGFYTKKNLSDFELKANLTS